MTQPQGRVTGPADPSMVAMFAGLTVEPVDEMPDDYGRWLIQGPQGSGKTTLASTIGELGPTLFIDLTGERGIRSFKGAPYARNLRIVRPTSITAMDDIYWQLAKGGHPYKAVVIDSLTAVQKMTMRFMLGHTETAVREIRQGTAPADQRTWGQALDVMTDTATFWFGLADGQRENPMHVVMTAQSRIKEDEGGEMRYTPDVQPGALSITLAAPDYIVYTDLEENPDSVGDDSIAPQRHIVRFGANSKYRTKGRLPYHLRGKIPPILGRKTPPSLVQLSRILGVGGVPPAVKAVKTNQTVVAPAAADPQAEEASNG